MATLVKKENISIVIEEYTDNSGALKKKHRTIGEIVTMRGDDGSEYQFGKMWGAGGTVDFNIYAQDDSKGQKPHMGQQQAPQQQMTQPMQQQAPQQTLREHQAYDQYANPW